MTRADFVKFEKLVRTKKVIWNTDENSVELLRVELFENGANGTWVNLYGRNFYGSMSLERDLDIEDFSVLGPIHV